MDLEEDFWNTVAEVVDALNRRGKETHAWSADNGQAVEGWSVESYLRGAETRGQPGRGWWEETWGRWERILSTDGQFWDYQFDGYEGSDHSGTQLTHSLRPVPGEHLVGTKGKPFAEMKARLERLPYL